VEEGGGILHIQFKKLKRQEKCPIK